MNARRWSRRGSTQRRIKESRSNIPAVQQAPIKPEPSSSESQIKSDHRYERRIANWTVVVGAFTVVLAIATAGSAYVLWLTDHTLQDTLKAQTASSERQLRAYLGFEWGAVLLDSPAPSQVTAWIRLKNYGSTPAYKVKAWLNFARRPSNDEPFDQIRTAENEGVLEPTGNFNLSATLPNTPAQLQAVVDGSHSVFVWGRVDYVDAFDRPRFYSFRGRMNGPVMSIISDGREAKGWGFVPTRTGTTGD
ncbi:MAG: hypothetical protein PS018_03065 [bacterium]|nr:hypothetical protein [bacterium]